MPDLVRTLNLAGMPRTAMEGNEMAKRRIRYIRPMILAAALLGPLASRAPTIELQQTIEIPTAYRSVVVF